MKLFFYSGRRFAALVSIAVCIAALILSAFSVRSVLVAGVPSVMRETPLILIDPGHGGEDGGAQGVGGLLEKELNLDISLSLRDILLLMGYRVRMTRETDVMLSGNGSTRKMKDLNARLDAINAQDVSLCVSIHQNYYSGSGTARGAQVFYPKDCPSSKLIAESIQSSMREGLMPDNNRAVKPADSSIYILNNAKNPAVLVECAFLSDPIDALMLSKQASRTAIAFSIACGIADYFQQNV